MEEGPAIHWRCGWPARAAAEQSPALLAGHDEV